MLIAEASREDLVRVLAVEREAFGTSDEADLVKALLDDPTARPLLSLLAWEGHEAVGHILFTKATMTGADDLTVAILAPLAVIPHAQRRGIGGRLIEHGVEHLAQAGVDLVFVLGHPDYYPRHGFVSAIPLGFEAPYPVAPQEAWMVRALRPGLVGDARGTIACAEVLDHPEYWRE